MVCGKKLSGGQQQKVAILRGLQKDCPIRLFDEVTASLDAQSAAEVIKSLESMFENKTSIMITHKLIEAKDADQIIVLDKGRAIAQGTHEELLQTCDLYQKLWAAYLKAEAKEKLSHRKGDAERMSEFGIHSRTNQKVETKEPEIKPVDTQTVTFN